MLVKARGLYLNAGGRIIYAVEHFCLRKGEVLALVGPNGAGKTSLLLTLARLQEPTGGTILFDGEIAEKHNLIAMRRRMAVVFQEALLLNTTVAGNIMTALRVRGVPRRVAAARTQEWLAHFGIEHLAHRPARQISGGEAQRVNLARALALAPDVLFLDEPFAALDYPTRNELISKLGEILKVTGTTTLFVTHDFTEIPAFADRVAVMFNGKIIKEGKTAEVFSGEILKRISWVPWDV
ncbi:MAG TPA: ATP-binding cassette domain-containing protein [Desulfotomaculum sp.]|nr:ATP-binding cassette domain-containing protein [Desulfotomaculum sp.]